MSQENSQTTINSNNDFIKKLQILVADGCDVPREFVEESNDHGFPKYIAAMFHGIQRSKPKSRKE